MGQFLPINRKEMEERGKNHCSQRMARGRFCLYLW